MLKHYTLCSNIIQMEKFLFWGCFGKEDFEMGKEENSYIIIDKNNKYDKGPLSRRGQKWTEAEDESLMREFSSGKSLVSIAKSHKRTKGGIIARLRKNGIEEEELLKFAENDEEQDIEEIWAKDGKLLDEDSMFADKKGTEEDDCSAYRFLTEEERLIYISNKWDKNRFVRAERKSIKDAFSKGVPLDEIALYHGRSVKKIIKKLKQFGVWQDNRKPVYKNMSKDDIETLFLKRKHISDKEGLEIWQEAYRGKKLEKISLEHGVSVECIIKKFVDMQVFSGIENNINIQANTQNKEEKKSNKQEIINKFKEGKSIDEIAEMLDLPRETIERKLERWGYLNYWEKQNEKSNEYENVWVEKNGKWHRVWTEKEED